MYTILRFEGTIVVRWDDEIVFLAEDARMVVYEGQEGPAVARADSLSDEELLLAIASDRIFLSDLRLPIY